MGAPRAEHLVPSQLAGSVRRPEAKAAEQSPENDVCTDWK